MTTETSHGRRGAPLMFLVAVVGGWTVARVATFTPLWVDVPSVAAPIVSQRHSASVATGFSPDVRFVLPAAGSKGPVREDGLLARRLPARANDSSPRAALPVGAPVGIPSVPQASLALATPPRAAPYPAGAVEAGLAPPPPRGRPAARWSADGWMLLRENGEPALAAANPSYGRSQAGAVLRYNLAPGSGHLPQAYVRATTALAGPREQEVAAGLSVRLGRNIPLRLAGEARVSETGGRTEMRPAAYAVTELSPFKLPLGAQGGIYLQGGYVGGSFATAFIDGQARVERALIGTGDTEFSFGGGVWGGAQKGAARLDAGPTAALRFRLGPVRGRVAADYRFRIAGDAAPASGPALMVSAGF